MRERSVEVEFRSLLLVELESTMPELVLDESFRDG